MLHSAILFDAWSTVRDAVVRLEQNRIWLDLEAPGARVWLDRLETAGVTEALDRLEARIEGSWVAVRMQHFGAVLWYRRRLPHVLDRLRASGDEGASLKEVLDLQEDRSDETRDAADDPTGRFEGFEGVVLDGPTFIGVAGPEGVSAQPPTPPPVPAPPAPFPFQKKLGRRTRSATRPQSAPKMEDILSSGAEPDRTPPAGAAEKRVFRVHPLVSAPPLVEGGQLFDLEVGLSPEVTAGVTGGEMRIERPAAETTFDVHLQVTADGFDAPAGWSAVLVVRHDDPSSARARIPLRALPPPPAAEPERAAFLSAIAVEFLVDGVRCGEGTRRIAVVPKGFGALPLTVGRGVDWVGHVGSPGAMALSEPEVRADLEVTLAKPDGNETTGRFKMTFRTPHDVALPDHPLDVDLGADARSFAKGIIEEIRIYHGTVAIGNNLAGLGSNIADRLPPEFWRVVRDVAAKVGAARPGVTPSLLLYSADPWVPWELAYMEDAMDPTRPPFLGAQMRMGRWITGANGRPPAPATTVEVSTIAGVVGMYAATSGFAPLPQAQAEVAALTKLYRAVALDAEMMMVSALLGAQIVKGSERVGAEAVHFAAHGEVDPSRPESAALYLSDGLPLKPSLFRRSALGEKHRPFLFLNACMVGTGGEALGDADGFPGNCLKGGFRALLAPLWAVDDKVAHDFALEFYRRAFGIGGEPEPVGAILRDLRKQYDSGEEGSKVHTYLAYVFYGHPELTLRAAWQN